MQNVREMLALGSEARHGDPADMGSASAHLDVPLRLREISRRESTDFDECIGARGLGIVCVSCDEPITKKRIDALYPKIVLRCTDCAIKFERGES